MPENLLCPKQKASTPAFREGWDRVFNRWTTKEIEEAQERANQMSKILQFYFREELEEK